MKDFNPEQYKVHLKILGIVNENKRKIIRLTGEAGAGKTFLTSKTLDKLCYFFPDKKVLVITTSHQALENFKSHTKLEVDLEKHSGQISFKTISASLKQFPIGRKGFSKPDNTALLEYDVILVDEFSTVGEVKTRLICEGLNKNAVAIFIGDPYQLTPVMDKKSEITKATEEDCYLYGGIPFEAFHLTIQMRQQGDLYSISQLCRDRPYFLSNRDILVRDSSQLFVHSHLKTFLDKAISTIKEHGVNSTCIFNYTNKETLRLGKYVRSHILSGDNNSLFAIGESLSVTSGSRWIKRGYNIVVEKLRDCSDYGVNFYFLNDRYLVCHRSQQNKFYSFLNVLEKLKNEDKCDFYKKLYKVYEQTLIVGYSYSKTLHSAQGVTLDYAFINTPDLLKCRTVQKELLYVAYSRARKEAHSIEI